MFYSTVLLHVHFSFPNWKVNNKNNPNIIYLLLYSLQSIYHGSAGLTTKEDKYQDLQANYKHFFQKSYILIPTERIKGNYGGFVHLIQKNNLIIFKIYFKTQD